MSGTARLSPFRVHVADQILAALTEAAPLPLSTGGYDGSIWPHHDGFKWLHSVDNWTVRSGPVKSGSEKEEQIRGGARSRRHWRPADRGGADSSRPSGAGASRHSQSTGAIEDRTGYGRGLVYQMLIRLAAAGEVDRVTPRGTKPCFWRARPADGHPRAEVA